MGLFSIFKPACATRILSTISSIALSCPYTVRFDFHLSVQDRRFFFELLVHNLTAFASSNSISALPTIFSPSTFLIKAGTSKINQVNCLVGQLLICHIFYTHLGVGASIPSSVISVLR